MWGLIASILGGILGSKGAGGQIIRGALSYANSARNQPQPQANQI